MWLSKFLATTSILARNMPTQTHCKTGSSTAWLVFGTGGEVVVLRTNLLSGSANGCCLLNLKEGKELKEVLEA